MKNLLSLLLIVALIGCANQPVKKETGDSLNICTDCKKDDFKSYTPCYAVVNGKRACDLCDTKCCDFPENGGKDRCCCLHQRDDCFKVCVAKKIAAGIPISDKHMAEWKAWQATLPPEKRFKK